jgi:hypothetical protein
MSEYMTAAEAAKKWNISHRRVQTLCGKGRIEGVFKLGEIWAIPANAKKPNDARVKIQSSDSPKKDAYNVIDLFCGAGGLSYGFERAGFRTLAGVDNDEAALKTFKLNHENSETINSDITKLTYSDIKNIIGNYEIDVVIGGPPCQGMSLSGPRKFDAPRNKLYLSYIRLVEEIKPKVFIIENVPGLVGCQQKNEQ